MDKVVHFEIPADDVKRAEKFYEKTFGWNIDPMPEMEYTIVRTAEVDEKFMPKEVGSINGGMFKRTDELAGVMITIAVKDIDEHLKTIEKNGGKIARKKTAVGDMGFVAYFKDTEGNIVGLWENAKK